MRPITDVRKCLGRATRGLQLGSQTLQIDPHALSPKQRDRVAESFDDRVEGVCEVHPAQAALEAMGVSLDPSAISRIENGDRSISDIEILAICRALDVPVTTILTDG